MHSWWINLKRSFFAFLQASHFLEGRFIVLEGKGKEIIERHIFYGTRYFSRATIRVDPTRGSILPDTFLSDKSYLNKNNL